MVSAMRSTQLKILNHRVLPVTILLLVSSGTAVAQNPDSSRTLLLQAARELMLGAGQCALITADNRKQPRVRTMDAFEPEENFIVWLGTNPKSRKVTEIRKNNDVILYYTDGDNGYVSLYGKAELVNDASAKAKYWKPEWEVFYPDRDQSYLLIKVVPSRIEIISYRHGLHGDPVTWQPHAADLTKR